MKERWFDSNLMMKVDAATKLHLLVAFYAVALEILDVDTLQKIVMILMLFFLFVPFFEYAI